MGQHTQDAPQVPLTQIPLSERSLLCPLPESCWITAAGRGVGPSPKPSDSPQVPVSREDKPVQHCPRVSQLHPSLLPPGSVVGTSNQAVLTAGPPESFGCSARLWGRCSPLHALSLASLLSSQPELIQDAGF